MSRFFKVSPSLLENKYIANSLVNAIQIGTLFFQLNKQTNRKNQNQSSSVDYKKVLKPRNA